MDARGSGEGGVEVVEVGEAGSPLEVVAVAVERWRCFCGEGGARARMVDMDSSKEGEPMMLALVDDGGFVWRMGGGRGFPDCCADMICKETSMATATLRVWRGEYRTSKDGSPFFVCR